jgi:hypothetical protein
MRFRVTHLLMAAVLVAFFSIALSHPTNAMRAAALVVSCMIFGQLIGIAFRSKRRDAAIGAVVGIIYLAVRRIEYGNQPIFTPPPLIDLAYHWLHHPDYEWHYPLRTNFVYIAEFGLSLLWAFIGGALGAYWSKPHSPPTKE